MKTNVKTLLKIVIIPSLIIGIVPNFFVMAEFDRPHVVVTEISLTPEVTAGEIFNEIIELSNVGSESAYRVQLEFYIENPFAIINSSSTIFIGKISKSKSESVSIPISVDKKAVVGIYSIAFIVRWEDNEGIIYSQSNTFNVKVLETPQVDIQEVIIGQDPSQVAAGDSFIKTLRFTNEGVEEARMVRLSLDVRYPFTLTTTSSNIFLGDLGIDENRIVSLDILVDRNAVGVYSISYTISFTDSSDRSYEKEGEFGVEILGKPIKLLQEEIFSEKTSRVFTGDTFTKKFNLTNVSGYEAKRIQISLDVNYPFALTSSSSNLYIGDLTFSESKISTVRFSVDRNAPVAVYSIPYTITYENDYGESYEETGEFGVEVSGHPQLLIDEIIVDPSPLTLGQKGLMILKVSNVGSDVARDTSIRIFGGTNILASSFAYIANLNSKDTESITFPISIDNNIKLGTYLMNVTISYNDYLNTTYHSSNLHELKVISAPAFVPPFYIGATIGLASISLLGYLFYVWNPSDSGHEAELEEKESSKTRRLRNDKRGRFILLIMGVIVMYVIIFPIPYIVHTNLDNAGIVVYSNTVELESLPNNIQEICSLRGIYEPNVLLVRHIEPKWFTLVISSESYYTGTMVEMSDYIIDWYVDWHDFNIVDQPFQKFAISDINKLGSIETFFERALLVQEDSISLFDLSKVTFYGGPILFILCLTLITQKRLAIWNLPACLGLYSFQTWVTNIIASIHHIAIATEWVYFGYLFAGLIPLAIYAWHFERSAGGRSTALKMKTLSRKLGLLWE